LSEQNLKSINTVFKNIVEKSSSHIALIYLGEKYSYDKLDAMVEQLAGSLFELGVKQNDKVIIYLPHCPQWVIAWLAILRLGAMAIPVTHFYGPKDLKYVANDSGAETVFCMDTNYGYIDRIVDDTQIKRIIVSTLVDLLPSWKKLVGHLLDKIPKGKFDTRGKNVYTFPELLKHKTLRPPIVKLTGKEIAEILYTGGTTGFPKGVPICHALLLESCIEQRAASSSLIPIGEDIVLQGSPLYHILGQAVGFGALFTGETLIILPKMSLDAIFDHFQRYNVKTFLGTPTLYRMILEHDRLDQYNLRSLRYVFSGGDVLPEEVANRWFKKFGNQLYQGYGATETCGGVTGPRPMEETPKGTAGKFVSFQKNKLLNSDTLEEVPEGQPGELFVSSENMVLGYWNKPEETAMHFVNIYGKIWYRTGDIVRVDEKGWLFFLDRSVDVIKHKGYRVAASKIDSVLQEHPAVIAACTIGIKDKAVGERIKSFVILKKDVRGVSAYDLIKWCKQRLNSYEIPQYIEFRDMLPKSKVGKILRRELRDEDRRKLENT